MIAWTYASISLFLKYEYIKHNQILKPVSLHKTGLISLSLLFRNTNNKKIINMLRIILMKSLLLKNPWLTHQCLIHATSFGVRFNVWYEWYDWDNKLKRRFKLLSLLLTVIDFDRNNESYNEVIFKTSCNLQKKSFCVIYKYLKMFFDLCTFKFKF